MIAIAKHLPHQGDNHDQNRKPVLCRQKWNTGMDASIECNYRHDPELIDYAWCTLTTFRSIALTLALPAWLTQRPSSVCSISNTD